MAFQYDEHPGRGFDVIAVVAAVSATTLQLASADIDIDVAAGLARAEYVVIADSTGFELVAMASTTELTAVETPAPWERERGLYRIRVESTAGERSTLRLQYRFLPGTQRVPVFVPSVPTHPETSRIAIRVRGAAPTAGLGDAFPRLARESDGTLVARPANVPSFVILPAARGGLYVNRAADLVVVLLLLGASVGWWLRKGRT